jgi:hypothetical protein
MKPTAKRGLIRLAVVLMIGWNLYSVWSAFATVNESRTRTIRIYLDIQSDCMTARPYAECHAEYEKSTGGYSQWKDIKGQFAPLNIAVIELLPPIVIGLVWLLIWGSIGIVRWVLRGFGIQFKQKADEAETSEPVPVMGRLSAIGHWFIAPRNILALSVGIVALAGCV